jgi:cytochrome c-type biogenesis protein CcmH/NrfG
LDPSNLLCRLQLAVYYQQHRQGAEAVRFYKAAARIDPNDVLTQLNLGRMCLRLNRIQESERAFREVIRLKPDRPEGYGELARLYLVTRNRLAEARVLAEKAVSVAPQPAYYALLSRTCAANSDREAALTAIEQAIMIEPTNQEYLQARELLLGVRQR